MAGISQVRVDVAVPDRAAVAVHAISIIDLDRTLTRRGTYSPFLLHFARHHAPARLLLVPVVLACMAAYKLGVIRRKQLKVAMHRLMIGGRLHRSAVERIVTSFADREVRLNCFDQGRSLIERERAESRMVIIATAAHRLYAREIAARLNVDRLVATESVWEGDALLPSIHGENCYGPEKLRRIEHYLRQIGLRREYCSIRFYSDDISDTSIFEWSDEPIVVNPSERLKAMAAGRRWKIIDWR